MREESSEKRSEAMMAMNEGLYGDAALCSSRKYLYPPHGRSMEILRGVGVSKPHFSKESMGLNWNFQRDGGIQTKNLPWEGYGYFLLQTATHFACTYII